MSRDEIVSVLKEISIEFDALILEQKLSASRLKILSELSVNLSEIIEIMEK